MASCCWFQVVGTYGDIPLWPKRVAWLVSQKTKPSQENGKRERELMIYHYDPSGLLGWFPKKQNPHMKRAKEREFLRGDLWLWWWRWWLPWWWSDLCRVSTQDPVWAGTNVGNACLAPRALPRIKDQQNIIIFEVKCGWAFRFSKHPTFGWGEIQLVEVASKYNRIFFANALRVNEWMNEWINQWMSKQ